MVSRRSTTEYAPRTDGDVWLIGAEFTGVAEMSPEGVIRKIRLHARPGNMGICSEDLRAVSTKAIKKAAAE